MTVHAADEILALIDAQITATQEDGFRRHLGASSIGDECSRALWYTFRWATRARHKASLVRLFNRGHREEERFIGYLKSIGVDVRAHSQRLCYHDGSDSYVLFDWDVEFPPDVDDVSDDDAHIHRAATRGVKAEQWRIKDVEGHFGGSMDSILYNVPGVDRFGLTPRDPVLGEYKTHGQKSFDELVSKGLAAAKPAHYQQMQVYMGKRGIKLGLYMAVNKNTDEIKCFWIEAAPMICAGLIGKARDVINSPLPPMRINSSPSWFKCRFCDHRGVCHMGEPMEKTCRSCAFSKPIEGREWYCAKWQSVIPYEHTKAGCAEHSSIKE